jgi:hypothetical protein
MRFICQPDYRRLYDVVSIILDGDVTASAAALVALVSIILDGVLLRLPRSFR